MVRTFGGWNVETTLDPSGIIHARQVHGSVVHSAKDANTSTEADGLFVDRAGVKAGVWTADCMPLVLIGDSAALILHVSRKTLVAGLLENVPNFINPKEIQQVFIGPHICLNHFSFEWEGEGIVAFKQKFPQAVEVRDGMIHLSLRQAVQHYFDQWGITPEEITGDGRCTYEEADLPSYRRWLAEGKPGAVQNFLTSLWR